MIEVFPLHLRRFQHEMRVVGGALPVHGFGRVTFSVRDARTHHELFLHCGRTVFAVEIDKLDLLRTLRDLETDPMRWYANVAPARDDFVDLSLFALKDAIPARGAGFVSATDDVVLPVEGLTHHDGWVPERFALVRVDQSDHGLRLVGPRTEALLTVVGDRVAVGDPVGHRNQFPPSRWIILAGVGIDGETTEPWPASALGRLEQHASGASDFMEAWEQYMELEERLVRELHDDLGRVRYGKVRRADGPGRRDGDDAREAITIRVDRAQPDAVTLVEGLAERHAGGMQLALELTEDDPWVREGQRGPVGRIVHVEKQSGDVHLEMDARDSWPDDGWCSVSIRGDIAQITRRRDALNRLANDDAGIPTLRSILFQRAPAIAPRARSLPRRDGVSNRVSKVLAELTERQRRAVEIALTTPDVVMIQGPPGTGKTKVITAIEQALAEIEGPARSSRLVLLTSTQNDAVDQVAAKTRIFGLPPNREGSRGFVDPIADWRRERISAAQDELDASADHRRDRLLTDRYVQMNESPVRLDDLVLALVELASLELDGEIRRRARSLTDDLRSRRMKPSRRLRLEARIRSLRHSEVSWDDDGPERLNDLISEVSRRGVPREWTERFALRLEDIARDVDGPWLLIREIKQELLDVLADETDDRPRRAPKEVLDLFADAIGVARRSRPDHGRHPLTIEQALEAYLEDIEQHPSEADQAIREYTVVHAATCQRSSVFLMPSGGGRRSERFQNTIVDEAARVSPLDLVIPLVQARERVILVGDHRQLPAVYDEGIARGLPQGKLLQECIFERLFLHLKELDKTTGVQRTITLDQQFRMHPRLGSFVSRVFYEPHGESIDSDERTDELVHNIDAFSGRTSVWVDVPADQGPATKSARKSWSRAPEADRVAALVSNIVHDHPDLSVGVITFYGDQRDLILERLVGDLTEEDYKRGIAVRPEFQTLMRDGRPEERLRVGTVDAFQGKEFDIVVLSMVRSRRPNPSLKPKAVFGFLTVENRFCVALSRQKKLLIVVGDRSMVDVPQAESIIGLRELRDLCDEDEVAHAR